MTTRHAHHDRCDNSAHKNLLWKKTGNYAQTTKKAAHLSSLVHANFGFEHQQRKLFQLEQPSYRHRWRKDAMPFADFYSHHLLLTRIAEKLGHLQSKLGRVAVFLHTSSISVCLAAETW